MTEGDSGSDSDSLNMESEEDEPIGKQLPRLYQVSTATHIEVLT